MSISLRYIKKKSIRDYVKLKGKRLSPAFLLKLDDHVQKKLDDACSIHNGGKKTLDGFIASFIKL